MGRSRVNRRWISSLLLAVGILILVAGLCPSTAGAQATALQTLYLQEFGPFVGRTGDWIFYTFPPGGPFDFGILGAPLLGAPRSADFLVNGICSPSANGGVFLSPGAGFGDLAAVGPWPFQTATFLPGVFDLSGNPLNLCDENADEGWIFAYGDSLNLLPGGVTSGIPRFAGSDFPIVDSSCHTIEQPVEGLFMFARRSRSRQTFDIFCSNQTDGQMTLRAGNVLICRLPIGATWVNPATGIPTGRHLHPVFGLETCQWYATCTGQPIGADVPRSTAICAPGGGGGNGRVVVTVRNGNTGQPVTGATVTFPGGPTQTTNSSGQTTFTNVPTGVSVTFTANASGFGAGSAAVTAAAGTTTPLTINLPVIVSCSPFSHSGGDVGDTQVVEMGKTPATFQFDFETFSQKDRIVVTHDGTLLFDTGCVGANGSQMLSYSGGSTQVRVQVTANCAGGTGTSWNYTVHCPVP